MKTGSAGINLGHGGITLNLDKSKKTWSLEEDGEEFSGGKFKDERDLIFKLKSAIKKHDPDGYRDEFMSGMTL